MEVTLNTFTSLSEATAPDWGNRCFQGKACEEVVQLLEEEDVPLSPSRVRGWSQPQAPPTHG